MKRSIKSIRAKYRKSLALSQAKGWFGNIFRRTPKPDQPHQDLHGKPCGVGQNTARDGCIANEDDAQSGNKKPNNSVSSKPQSNRTQEREVSKDSKVADIAKRDWKQNGVKSQSFKNWFGDWENDPENASKVVDDDGAPKETHKVKKVYHGTASDFNAFSSDNIGTNGSISGDGFYFSDNEEVAKSYYKKGGRIISAYLSIKNPFDFDKQLDSDELKQLAKSVGEWWRKKQSDYSAHDVAKAVYKSFGGDNESISGFAAHKAIASVVGIKEVNKAFQNLGYDGITHLSKDVVGSPKEWESGDDDDDIFGGSDMDYGRVWVAFVPTQIKSTDNEGTFDLSDADMTKNLSGWKRYTKGLK